MEFGFKVATKKQKLYNIFLFCLRICRSHYKVARQCIKNHDKRISAVLCVEFFTSAVH